MLGAAGGVGIALCVALAALGIYVLRNGVFPIAFVLPSRRQCRPLPR